MKKIEASLPHTKLDPPFGLAASPRYFYLTQQYKDLLQLAIATVLNGEGLGIIAGEVGTGKSTLLRYLIDWFASEMPAGLNLAVMPNVAFRGDFQLLKAICAEFGLDPRPRKDQQLEDLRVFLVEAHAKKQTTAVIIDEAHKLSPAQLELVRELFNFHHETGFYCTVLLSGEAIPLKNRLKQRKAIRDRAVFYGTINPLSLPDLVGLIQYRLRTAGYDENIFDDDAYEAMHRYSGGVPRRLVKLGRLAFALHKENPTRISLEDIQKVYTDNRGAFDD